MRIVFIVVLAGTLLSCNGATDQDPAQLSLASRPIACREAGPFAGRVAVRLTGHTVPPADLRLEASPYPEGFDVGRFASIGLDRQAGGLDSSLPQGSAPPLDHLELTATRTEDAGDALVAELTGLESGLLYQLRAAVLSEDGTWNPGPVTSVEAPSCFGESR